MLAASESVTEMQIRFGFRLPCPTVGFLVFQGVIFEPNVGHDLQGVIFKHQPLEPRSEPQ